jgi:hypothetical protein
MYAFSAATSFAIWVSISAGSIAVEGAKMVIRLHSSMAAGIPAVKTGSGVAVNVAVGTGGLLGSGVDIACIAAPVVGTVFKTCPAGLHDRIKRQVEIMIRKTPIDFFMSSSLTNWIINIVYKENGNFNSQF